MNNENGSWEEGGGGGTLKGFFVIFFEATPQLEIGEPGLFEIRNSRTSIDKILESFPILLKRPGRNSKKRVTQANGYGKVSWQVGYLISVCMVCLGAPGAPGRPEVGIAAPRPRCSSNNSRACASRVTA